MNNTVPPGYKQTEVGVIPEDWEVSHLGHRASFRTGPFGSALHKSDYTNNGVPIINPMHIIDGQLVPTDSMSISEEAAKNLAEFRLKTNEIVIGRRGDMGRCAVVLADHSGWLCGTGSMIVRCDKETVPGFLQRVLSSPRVIAAIEDTSVGSTMINLNQGTLSGLRLQFPPTAEQHAIAAALSDVDALISGLDRLIAKKRDIKQAAMQQLLTGKQRLPGFDNVGAYGNTPNNRGECKSVKSGECHSPLHTGIPDGWEVKRLGEICSMKSGDSITSASIDDHSKFPCYGGNGLRGFTDHFTHDGSYALIGRQGALCGNIMIAEGKFFASEHAIVVTAAKETNINWLAIVLIKMNLNRLSESSAQPGLSVSKLLPIVCKVPPLPEQTAIATILSDMDAEITTLEARRDKSRAIKQGMMQELLTGKTRLNLDFPD